LHRELFPMVVHNTDFYPWMFVYGWTLDFDMYKN
jgi:hypothetical protein